MEIGARLAAARQRRGLSQAELSRRSGVGQATISRLENEEDSSTTITVLVKLSESLGVSPAIFLDDGKDTGRVWSFEREIPSDAPASFVDQLDMQFRQFVRLAVQGPRRSPDGPNVNDATPADDHGYFKMKTGTQAAPLLPHLIDSRQLASV